MAFLSPATVTEVVCHECGRAHHHRPLPPGATARCVRCGSTLYRHRPPTFDQALALTVAGVVLFIVANVFPFLGFQMGANVTQTTLVTGSIELYKQGMWVIALVVVLTSIVAPGIQLATLLYVLVPLRFGKVPHNLGRVYRIVADLIPLKKYEADVLRMKHYLQTEHNADI